MYVYMCVCEYKRCSVETMCCQCTEQQMLYNHILKPECSCEVTSKEVRDRLLRDSRIKYCDS